MFSPKLASSSTYMVPSSSPEELMTSLQSSFLVNSTSQIAITNALLPLLLHSASQNQLAKVIMISSAVGDPAFTLGTQFPGHVLYALSKSTLSMALAKYASEFADKNIVFFALSPGVVSTSVTPRSSLALLHCYLSLTTGFIYSYRGGAASDWACKSDVALSEPGTYLTFLLLLSPR